MKMSCDSNLRAVKLHAIYTPVCPKQNIQRYISILNQNTEQPASNSNILTRLIIESIRVAPMTNELPIIPQKIK